MFKKIRNWAKNSDTFEVMAIVAIIIGATIMITAFWLGSINNINLKDADADIVDLSEFIGGLVGSLWSLAGVLLFYASLSSQKEDLERQRELLVKQIDEVVAQTKEFRIQNEMSKDQKNEETVFQLLRFHSEIISTITIEQQEVDFVSGENINKTIEGRKSFVEYYDIFKRFFQEASELSSSQDDESLSKIFDKAYNSFYLEYQADLGHYFRNLYNIIFFIDSLKKTQQSFYLGLLMAQLSNYELTLLFFHCLRSTNKDFKLLVEKYAILDQVPKDEVTTMAHTLYDSSAFGESGFGSGDIIEDEMDGFNDDSVLSTEETDSVLSKFNLPDMSTEESNTKQDSGLGTMDDILSKLKKISSEKFPEMNELDNIDGSSEDSENEVEDENKKMIKKDNPLDRLREKKEKEQDKEIVEENDDSEFSLEDFFDDDGSEFDYDNDDDIINLDDIAKIETEGINNLLNGNNEDNDEGIENDEKPIVKKKDDSELDINSDFEDLFDDEPNKEDENEELDEESALIKQSFSKSLDDDLSSLKKQNIDEFEEFKSDEKFDDLKNKLDSDMELDDMLFNKDADIKNEKKKSINDPNSDFNFDTEDDELDKVKSKFNINFDEENKPEKEIDEFGDDFDLGDFEDDDIESSENELEREEELDDFGDDFDLSDFENDDVEDFNNEPNREEELDEFGVENFPNIKNKFNSNIEELEQDLLKEEEEKIENSSEEDYSNVFDEDQNYDINEDEAESQESKDDLSDDVKSDNNQLDKENTKENKSTKKLKIKVNEKTSKKKDGGKGFLSKLK